jgi:hypothetical protein
VSPGPIPVLSRQLGISPRVNLIIGFRTGGEDRTAQQAFASSRTQAPSVRLPKTKLNSCSGEKVHVNRTISTGQTQWVTASHFTPD